MSARKGKGFGLTQLRGPQPRPEAPDLAEIGEQRLAGAFQVAIEQVVPDVAQPRRDWAFDDGDQKLQELAASIREFGIFQPLVVREDGALDDRRTRYIVIAGGRRRAAAEIAGLRLLPVLVRGEEGTRLRVMQLLENLQRQELSPLDEARALQELLDAENLNAPQLAERIHKSAQHIRSRLRILADQVIADAIERRQIPVTAARMIQQLPDEEVLRFRTRLRDGETLHLADVIGARERLRAEGVENPRYKGGGRRNPAADAAPIVDTPTPVADMLDEMGEQGSEQTVFVPSPPQKMAQHEIVLREGGDGGPDADAVQVDHPAAQYAVARAIGALIRRNMPEHIRQEIDARLAALGDPSDWLPGLYAGIADKQHVYDDTK